MTSTRNNVVSLIKDLKSSSQDRWFPAIRQESFCKVQNRVNLVSPWRKSEGKFSLFWDNYSNSAPLSYEWADCSEGTRQSWKAGTAEFQGNSIPRHHHSILVCWTMGTVRAGGEEWECHIWHSKSFLWDIHTHKYTIPFCGYSIEVPGSLLAIMSLF